MSKRVAKVFAAELEGVQARLVEVEVDLNVGLHSFQIVGLADKALNEARERVNSALKNSGAKPPNRENRKITVNLAPADVKKTGSQYDLAIAVGYLAATEQIKRFDASDKMFVGELALNGELRPVHGALNIAEMAASLGFKYLFLPDKNAPEASVIGEITIVPLRTLQETIDVLEERGAPRNAETELLQDGEIIEGVPDFAEIKGQEYAKRALVIAAAGGHNVLMSGPPGVGKSLLAQALLGILPRPSLPEAIEITKIYSAAGLAPDALVQRRPFRSPHHTASLISIVGGGTNPRPGEISLSHRGILFLDELPEFPKNILEALRQPLESGVVHIARAKATLAFPARFTLVAAMNPCPCGYGGDPEKECKCAAYDVIRYQKKISGPLMDRIDLQVKVSRVNMEELRDRRTRERASPLMRKRIESARAVQENRFADTHIRTNAEMSSKQTDELCALDRSADRFLRTIDRARLSPRGYYRLLKTARTIADLDEQEQVTAESIAEAFSYRLREET